MNERDLSVDNHDTLTRSEWLAAVPDSRAGLPPDPVAALVAAVDAHRPGWQRLANCRDMDTNVFFPTKGDSQSEAKEACNGCVVRAECLAAGMTEKWGVWGGESERGRKRIRTAHRGNSGMQAAS